MQNPGQRQRAPAPHSGEGPAAGQPIHLVRGSHNSCSSLQGCPWRSQADKSASVELRKGHQVRAQQEPLPISAPDLQKHSRRTGGWEEWSTLPGASQAPTTPHPGTECPDPRRCDQGRQLSPSASASRPGPRVTREHLRPGPVDSPPGEATPKSSGNLRSWRLPQSGESLAAKPGSDGGGGRRAGRSTGCGRVSTGWGGQPRPLDSGSCGCAPGLTAQPLL